MKKPITLRGVVILKAEQGLEGSRLEVEDATGVKQVEWGLPSPLMGNKYPNNPWAMKGRFKVNDVILEKNKIATVWLVMPNGERARLATFGC